ncbi:MAG: ATP-binding protein [Planctomycetota bacterium]|jgi:CO dehydrogenase maturation factor
MAVTIAVSGKGGSGKTTFSAMMMRCLIERAPGKAVLGVDADSNSCLGITLGAELIGTVADIRDQARALKPSNAGMDRLRTVEYGIQQSLTEARGYDLLTMGRPEGPDCYCAVNNMLRKFLDELGSQYQFVVIDNEAGMEHLSRRTTNNVDMLCIVAEPNAVGEVTARRIYQLVEKLPIVVRKTGLVWNRAETGKKLDEIEILGHIPSDKAVSDASMQGKTVFDLDAGSPALVAAGRIVENILELSSS